MDNTVAATRTTKETTETVWITRKQAALERGVSLRTIQRMSKEGQIKEKRDGRRFLVDKTSLFEADVGPEEELPPTERMFQVCTSMVAQSHEHIERCLTKIEKLTSLIERRDTSHEEHLLGAVTRLTAENDRQASKIADLKKDLLEVTERNVETLFDDAAFERDEGRKDFLLEKLAAVISKKLGLDEETAEIAKTVVTSGVETGGANGG